MEKKLLIVLPSFLNGGNNTCLRSLLPVLKNNGFNVDVFAITNVGPNKEYASRYANILGVGGETITNISVPSIKQQLAKFVKKTKKFLCCLGIDISPIVFKKVATQLEKNNYDLIICFQEGITTHFCSYFNHTPKIAWVHCDYERCIQGSNIKTENNRYKGFDKVVCVSEFTKNHFLKYISSCKNVFALHNITDVDVIKSRAKETITDERFDFKGIRIVSVGRINEVKRFSEIPKIANTLKEKNLYHFKWYIIGDGDAKEKKLLEDNIKKYNTPEVILLGNKDNPYPYISQANLYVSTSYTEACPCVINEAKILHTPIVTTDFGSVYEFIENEVSGLISPLNNIAETIYSFLQADNKYGNMMQNINNFEFNNKPIIDKLLNEIINI